MKNVIKLKTIQLLCIMLLGFGNSLLAGPKFPANFNLQIINKSNMPISFVPRISRSGHKTNQNLSYGVIQPGATGSIPFQKSDELLRCNIYYYKSDNKTSIDPAALIFSPSAIPTVVYVYGDSATLSNALVAKATGDLAAGSLSRAVAFWTGTAIDPTIAGYDSTKQPVTMVAFKADGTTTYTF